MGALLGFLLILLIILVAYLLNGWALHHLWDWFLVPLGLPTISISWSIGIATMVGLMTLQYSKTKKEDQGEAFVYLFLRPLFALLVGWVCKEVAF